MIVRGALRCATCGKAHIVRIGMGHDTYEPHKFPCRQCKEIIGVALHVDYEKIAHSISYDENSIPMKDEPPDATIVNLDASFPVGHDDQGMDRAFPRFAQLRDLAQRAMTLGAASIMPLGAAATESRPDYAEEWKELRKAWSLHRNQEMSLSQKRVKQGAARFYQTDPLSSLSDWVWRFTTALVGPHGETGFLDCVNALKPALRDSTFSEFCVHYNENMRARHAVRFFRIMKEYFDGYSEFSQVEVSVQYGVPIGDGYSVASCDFSRTSMFYGNAFEILADVSDFFALLNNILNGRRFDEFERLSLAKYYELDKSSRFGPFSANPQLSAIVADADNQLRNASHHGGIEFNPVSQVLTYSSGKGGQGDARTMTYTEYLARCATIFREILQIMRVELVISASESITAPL